MTKCNVATLTLYGYLDNTFCENYRMGKFAAGSVSGSAAEASRRGTSARHAKVGRLRVGHHGRGEGGARAAASAA